MTRKLLVGFSLISIGVVAGVVAASRDGSTALPVAQEITGESAPAPVRRGFGTHTAMAGGDAHADQLQRRLDLLAAQVAADAAEQRRLQERLDVLAAQLAALSGGSPGTAVASLRGPSAVKAPPSTGDTPPTADVPATGDVPLTGDAAPNQEAEAAAAGVSPIERALVTAGIDSASAADIKHRQDTLALDEIYLRDQATREQWLDSPRFTDEMAKIAQQRTSIRDQVGDDAYDRYLAALGHPNRVRVEDVLNDSPAAQAGLQAGDIVLRYGDTRIFAADDLVSQTHSGQPGENVRIDVLRNGQPLGVDVPRGPLGVSIAGMVQPAPPGR